MVNVSSKMKAASGTSQAKQKRLLKRSAILEQVEAGSYKDRRVSEITQTCYSNRLGWFLQYSCIFRGDFDNMPLSQLDLLLDRFIENLIRSMA